MNELIKNLADDAGADDFRFPHGYGYALASECSIQRFAESIVEECVKAIPLDMDHTEYLKAMRAVKNVFGVK